MSTMSASQARASLPDILDRVVDGEEVTITRHGKAVAVVVRPDALRTRRIDAAYDQLSDLLDRGRSVPLGSTAPLSEERAEDLIADLRRSRDAR